MLMASITLEHATPIITLKDTQSVMVILPHWECEKIALNIKSGNFSLTHMEMQIKTTFHCEEKANSFLITLCWKVLRNGPLTLLGCNLYKLYGGQFTYWNYKHTYTQFHSQQFFQSTHLHWEKLLRWAINFILSCHITRLETAQMSIDGLLIKLIWYVHPLEITEP